MRRFIPLFLMALAALTFTSSASAQDSSEQARMSRELACLVGSWTGSGQVQMGGQEVPVEFEYTCRSAGGGAGVACHLEMTGMEGFTYQSDDLWGYDAGRGLVHWYTVTNAGETHDHSGRVDGRTFRATYVGRREGSPMRENVRFSFNSQNELTFSSVVFVDHQRVESFAGAVTKEARRAQADVH